MFVDPGIVARRCNAPDTKTPLVARRRHAIQYTGRFAFRSNGNVWRSFVSTFSTGLGDQPDFFTSSEGAAVSDSKRSASSSAIA
jgi:hypothetical protein